MAKSLHQITFEFTGTGEEVPKEFLSGIPISSDNQKTKNRRGRKPAKEPDVEPETVEIPEDEILFKKQYYSIREVAGMFKVNASLLRHWENEFDILQPRKNGKGDRHFRPVDVKNLQLIYDLVRRRKFTIEGAKGFIKKNNQVGEKNEVIQSLQKLKSFLLQIKADL